MVHSTTVPFNCHTTAALLHDLFRKRTNAAIVYCDTSAEINGFTYFTLICSPGGRWRQNHVKICNHILLHLAAQSPDFWQLHTENNGGRLSISMCQISCYHSTTKIYHNSLCDKRTPISLFAMCA